LTGYEGQLHVSFCGGRIGRGLDSRLPGEALALASHPDQHLDRERPCRIGGDERDSFSETRLFAQGYLLPISMIIGSYGPFYSGGAAGFGAYSLGETNAPEKLKWRPQRARNAKAMPLSWRFSPQLAQAKNSSLFSVQLRHSRCCYRDISNGGHTGSSRVYRRQIDAHCKSARRMTPKRPRNVDQLPCGEECAASGRAPENATN
jgi:hypothetical protein